MEKEINRCMGCMCEKSYAGACEMCGYTGDEPVTAGCIKPKTFLADRYVIGRMLSRIGEGTVYIAYDTVEKKPVEIKEFMPDTLCERTEDGVSVAVKDGCLPLYKSYLSEFSDLHKTLMSSTEGLSIKKIYGIFASGNTGYVVMEHPKGESLTEYLEKKGGTISWTETKALFPPVFDALKTLHAQGIVHRGISTDTLFVGENDRLMLTSLGISAGRTADSQIECNIFSGYAAGEQYALSERQGSWTDVYSVCAVLYRVLTGKVPPSAELRGQDDTLVPPSELNAGIPRYVSDTIMNGLKPDQSERLHDIDALVRRLYAEPTGEVARPVDDSDNDGPVVIGGGHFDDDESPRRAPQRRPVSKKKNVKRRKKDDKKSGIGTIIGFILFFALVIAFVIAIIYFSKESEKLNNENDKPSVTEETDSGVIEIPLETEKTSATTKATEPPVIEPAGERMILPNFVNRFFNSTLESRYDGLTFIPTYEYTDKYQAGIIFEQSIEEGTEVTSGTEIEIKVSKGRAAVEIPDYIGMKLDNYLKKLDEAKIKYETEAEETDEVKSGYVSRLSKEASEMIDITEDNAETLTVYYAVKPKVTTTTAKTKKPKDEETPEELPGEISEETSAETGETSPEEND